VSAAGWQGAVPILVLGETRRRTLADAVRARVERWRAQWAPGAEHSVRVTVPESHESAARLPETVGFRVSGDRPSLVMLVPARCIPQVVGVLGDAGASAPGVSEPHSLVEQLELRALTALAREFRTSGIPEPQVERLALATADLQQEYAPLRYVAAHVTLGEAKSPILVLLAPETVSALLPAQVNRASAERLDRRTSAIAQEVVGIEAVLGEGEVGLADLARLAVGDVIVLEQKLGDAASLTIRGGAPIVAAALGRVDSMRAVQIKRGATL
jgi:flagellar motor switch/type III secretory pathway protein FliN